MDNQIFINKASDFQKTYKESKPIFKIILIIFAAVLVVEILIGLKTLLTPIKVVKPTEPVLLSEASINLSTAKSSYKVGEGVPLLIKVSTGNRLSAGADLVLKYDPKILEVSTQSFVKGTAYDDYPAIDVDLNKGIIRVSGVVSASKQGFNGSGDFGEINFTAKASGETNISLEYLPNTTSDSNIMEAITNKDILEKGGSVKINIQ